MYLAPLNYDRFFKKVFKEPMIAKRFLEDFLDVEITHIEKLDEKHRLTDDAAVVEFDYRCKINDNFIIIDMQQWYKSDITKRFYLYHTLNSSLQLENLPTKLVIPEKSIKSENKKQKDYEYLEPVYTLIWMVDDTLNFTDDFAQFSMNHESVIEFINNNELWTNSEIKTLLRQREHVLNNLSNNTKNLSFLSQNKLIFMFQKNIVANIETNREHRKYGEWFDFALKTRNKDNRKDDFKEFEHDAIFKEVINRLKKDELNEDDIQYIEEEDEYIRLALDFYKKQKEELEEREQIGIEKGVEIGIEKGIEIEKNNQENLRKQEKNESARKMIAKGIAPEDICEITGLDMAEVINQK